MCRHQPHCSVSPVVWIRATAKPSRVAEVMTSAYGTQSFLPLW